jgi:hypothetical protein
MECRLSVYVCMYECVCVYVCMHVLYRIVLHCTVLYCIVLYACITRIFKHARTYVPLASA